MQLGLFLEINNVLNNAIFQKIFRDAVGRWSINESNLRLRRLDDDFEKVFTPYGRILDTASITNFHSWNLLNGAEYKDYLYDSPLGVDSNDDGISDGWSFSFNGFDGTVDKSIVDGVQRLTITNGGTNTQESFIFVNTSISNLEDYSIQVEARVFGDLSAKMLTTELPTGDSKSSDIVISSDWTKINLSNVVDDSDTTLQTKLRIIPNQIGSTGYVEYRNAVLVKNNFIEDIGLLTQDDNSDGVANGWTYDANGFDGTVVRSVSSNGQKLEITSGGTNTLEAFCQFETLIPDSGQNFILSVEARVSGDVSGRFRYSSGAGGNPAAIAGDTFNNTDWQTIDFNVDIITIGATPQFKIRIVPNSVGSTGYVEYRNATLKQTNNSVYVTEIQDVSGNGNHATQSTSSDQPRLVNAGVFEVDSDGNNSIYYDGTDDHFDITDNAGLNITSGGLSILAKHDPDNLDRVIMSRSDTSYSTTQYSLAMSSSIADGIFIINGSNGAETTTLETASQTIIATYDDITNKIYKNGNLEDTENYTTPLVSRNNVTIGARSSNADASTTSGHYQGHISEIAIFNKALTQSQVTTLTNRL